ncbi:MAG TPA: tetratricopeptide repeat protein [Candidatus Sulfotelmatobacter sp.]|nr:tetratricopeptide repeat protein [Candidatus Sulfotelmatobacter sp.]
MSYPLTSATMTSATMTSRTMPNWPMSRGVRLLRCTLAAFFILALSSAACSQESASLRGTVRDSQGKPIADAVVELFSSDSTQKQTGHSDSQGIYNLTGMREGVYRLKVTKTGYAEVAIDSVFLRSQEKKTLDVMLGAPDTAESALGKPQFSDEPQFTVAGVTDVSNLGGHGSDTVVRTREALAEDTASLGKTGPNVLPAGRSDSEKSLAESAAHIRSQLAQRDQADLHRQLAEIEEKLGNPLEAVRQYQRAAEMDPTENNYFAWGSEVLLHHAPQPALEIFAKGNALYPRSERILLGLAVTSFARGTNEDAIQRICQASDLNPNDPTPYVFLGRIILAETRPSQEAVEKLRRFAALQTDRPEAKYYYAVALWKQGKAEGKPAASQVESLLNDALRLDPKFAAPSLQLGIVHADEGKYAEAVANYRQAVQLDPEMEEAHYRLAQAYRQLGQAEQAKEELRVYEQLSKQSAEQEERRRHEIRQLVYTLRTVQH